MRLAANCAFIAAPSLFYHGVEVGCGNRSPKASRVSGDLLLLADFRKSRTPCFRA